MPTTINASTASAGLVQTADSSGVLHLQGNGNTGLIVGNTGKVSLPNIALATPSAGMVEYNGTAPFLTPMGTQRGVIPAEQLYVLSSPYVGVNATGAQSMFGVGVTLSSSTVYAFEAVYALSKSAGTTSHSLSILFGGTATLNSIAYQINGQYNGTGFGVTTTALSNMQPNFIQSAAAFSVGSNSTANIFFMVLVKGIVSINAGGTLIPQYQLSAAPGGAYSTATGSYFKIYPIGAAGSNISVGTWA